jgi:hypothetical protein
MANGRKLVTHDINGRPLRWRDHKAVVHAVELAPPTSNVGIGAWWTRCGQWNISRSEAWGGRDDEVTCPACRTIERGG